MATHPLIRSGSRAPAPIPTGDAPLLGFGLCARCWGIDRVLDQAHPLCRFCDPRLGDYLRRLAEAAQSGEAVVIELPTVELLDDPTGKEWAA